MQNTHVDALDLRSLRLLAVLLETRSITSTGEMFGLSQPAASRAIARLRQALGDPLLVRTSKGYNLTPRAQEIRGLLQAAQAHIDQLFLPPSFEPATSQRRFRIATTDYGVLTLIPHIMRRLASTAPGAGLIVAPWTDETLKQLEGGVIDAAFYADTDLPPDFRTRPLFEDTYAIVFDPQVIPAQSVESDPAQYRRVVLLYPDRSRLVADDPLQALGHSADQIVLAVPYFASMAAAIKGTPFIAAVPKRIAARLEADSTLAHLPLPLADQSFQYRLIWHELTHRDVALGWFRKEIIRSIGA